MAPTRDREVPIRLDELLHDAHVASRSDAPAALNVAGICDDSRAVKAGDLFVARPGPRQDGAAFARQAVAAGASAIVASTPLPDDLGVPRILVDDVREATGLLAHAFFGNPTQTLRVAAVTGTNGKTTVAYLIRHILDRVGIRCGLVSTVEIDDGSTRVEAEMTTPGAIELARQFAAMREHGCRAVAIEASSHALDQQRLAGTRVAAAGFTNLTGDHLDYHKTMDEYAAAKARLFAMLADDGAAGVVNADDAWSSRIACDTHAPIARFAIEDDGCPARREQAVDYVACDLRAEAGGTRFALRVRDGATLDAKTPLVGRHNVQNVLTAAAMAAGGFGVPIADALAALADARGAPGRLQRVVNQRRPGVSILVDYAHTDDALENVLRALRPLTRGKLRVVFGCGGDRDATKRPRMAAVARRLGDAVYVTSDNPRTEDPARIIDDIVAGLSREERAALVVEPDRRRAIHRAIADAGDDDVVLIAGKGHEKYQVVGRDRHHFDDVEEAESAAT